jgi:hypothetical protein
MKRCVLALLAFILITPFSFARIGDTAADFRNRFGAPIAEFFDKEGHGMRLYRSPEFKEVRVTFVDDKSEREQYVPADGVDKEAAFERIRAENDAEEAERSHITGQGQLDIGHQESAVELKFVSGDGVTRTYSGRLEIKQKANQDYAIVRDNAEVLEIPLVSLSTDAAGFRRGLECTIVVQNLTPDDLSSPVAWVGKREHVDAQDLLDDAHNQLQTLIKVESDGKRIYDRSFCSVHQRTMELRNVSVAFGMLAFSSAELYCQDKFPHYRDFGIGGCVMGEGDEHKMIPIYICPACVTACNEYKAAHPAPPRSP